MAREIIVIDSSDESDPLTTSDDVSDGSDGYSTDDHCDGHGDARDCSDGFSTDDNSDGDEDRDSIVTVRGKVVHSWSDIKQTVNSKKFRLI